MVLTHNCPNCGAPITGQKCEYCGTIFREDALLYGNFIVERPGAKHICAEAAIAEEMVKEGYEDVAAAYAKENIAHKMADALQDAIKYTVRKDPYERVVIIRGELRVLDPSFRF